MATIATRELLSRLESLYPSSDGSWAMVAAIAFSASNAPEAVPEVYKFVSQNLKTDEEQLALARKLRDGLFKSGLICGFPKAINALAQLHTVVPERFRDAEPLREITTSTSDINKNGQEYFNQTYGETASTVQPFLKQINPDLEFFSTTFAYGWTYGFFKVTTPAETSFSMVAALIANDTPRQVDWHLRGAMRNGASLEEIKAVRQIAIEASQASGVQWKNEIPDI
ncbi:hypothetical protein BDZ89DRAFT_1077208 [Hymenopellis radicata]|nr:hypothetical protein BDZ89DRAFT_1077208 [Hymenopellis radicata]